MASRVKRILLKTGKVFLWIIIGILFLIIAAVVALQFPVSQNYITQKAVGFVSKKTNTRVELGGINIAFPKSIVLSDLFLEDMQHDTLLYAHRLGVDVDMLKLISHKIELNRIEIEKLTSHINRSLPDSAFNFDFLINAFSSGDTTKVDTSKKSNWKFAIKNISLEKILFTFEDEPSGSNMFVNIGDFETHFKTFDLDEKKFHISNIELDQTSASIIQTKSSPPSPDSASEVSSTGIEYDIDVNDILLTSIHFLFQTPQQKGELQIGEAALDAKRIDLINQQIQLKKFMMNNSKIDFAINKYITEDTLAEKAKEAVTEKSDKFQSKPWKVSLTSLELENNFFAFNNFNSPPIEKGLDFNHLLLSGVEADIKNIRYDEKNISANIHELKARDRSGFELKHFQAKVIYDSVHAELADLDIQTGQSHIKKYAAISYPSIETLADSLQDLKVNIDLESTVVGLNDVLLIQPSLAENLKIKDPENLSIRISTRIKGAVSDLEIPHFELFAASNTALILKGNIKGLPKADASYFDIDLQKFSTTDQDLQSLFPADMLPDNIAVPASLNASGFFKGTMKYFNGKINIGSSFGDAVAEVQMKKSEAYHAVMTTDHFDLGQLLKNPEMLGPVTIHATVNGSGLTPETMKGVADIEIPQAVFKKYNYQNISVNGDFTGKQFDGTASINDSNVVLAFDGLLNFEKDSSYYKASLTIEGMDLQALHLTEEDLRITGYVKTDMRGSDPNDMNGTLELRKVTITKNDTIYPIDSVLFVSVSDTASRAMDIHSPFLTASFKGNIGIADLPTALKNHINRYFTVSDTSASKATEAQNFTFNIQILNSDLYTALVPDLKEFHPGEITGQFNSESQVLDVKAVLPSITYKTAHVDSFRLDLNSDPNAMNYSVGMSTVSSGEYKILDPTLQGMVAHDTVKTHFTVSDEKNITKYSISGHLEKNNPGYRFSIDEDSLMLNYEPWSVASDNYISFGSDGIYANDVILTNGNQQLKIVSTGSEGSPPPLEITFADFDLGDLAHMIESTEDLVGGLINGKITLKNLESDPAFSADLSINDFSFKEDTLGTIKVISDNETANRYNAKVNITGEGNDISAEGFYDAIQKDQALNFNVELRNVELSTLEAYMLGNARQMKGSMNGDLKILGSATKPDVTGKLNFNNARFNLALVNSSYELKDEQLTFDHSKVLFSNFTLRDSTGATAVVNGHVEPDPEHLVAFDLSVETKDFLAVNSSRRDSGLFYGKVILDSHTKVTGNKDFPKVDANIRLQDGSALTLRKPEEEIKNIESKGVVIFINRYDTLHPIMTQIKGDTSTTVKSQLTGTDVNANIEITRNSYLTIIIDPVSGDSLRLQGDATLAFSMDPSGKTSLTGRYEIAEGSYQLTFYNFIKREFKLEPGGSLTWNGDLLEADVDLTALYEVRTSAIDLVADQLTGLSEEEKNTYQQQLPFRLYMNMKGELMKPEITFSIDLPPNERGALGGSVYAKLNQLNENEADLNKQVFALLILNRFIAEDPLQSSQNNDVENVARNSVSQLLSQQLNRLASNYIKGVQLNVNLRSYEDYSTGQPEGRTELELGASKQLLNNRLTVHIGTNIDLEGEKSKQNTITSIVGDASAEYKLTPEGTYRLRGYRRGDYDILQGEITETAFGFVFTKDYNRARDLFKRSKEKEVHDIPTDQPGTVKPPIDK